MYKSDYCGNFNTVIAVVSNDYYYTNTCTNQITVVTDPVIAVVSNDYYYTNTCTNQITVVTLIL